MKAKIRPLSDYFATISDPRKAKGLRHPLVAILNLCCVAMMCGAKTPKAIANWWRNRRGHRGLLKRLGFTKAYGPSKSTIYEVLALVTVEGFEAGVNQWIEDNFSEWPAAQDGQLEGVAVDGKTLRGSRKQWANNAHLLSALSHRLGVTLRQLGVDDKTNEIGTMTEFLVDMVMEGRVFTMDALLTQREIAQTIIDGRGDYVMIVKENQPTLYADLQFLFAEPGAAPFIHDQITVPNKGHGRIEQRTLCTSLDLNDLVDWPGLQQVFRLDRKTIIQKTGQIRTETVYGITSLPPHQANATQLLTLTRGHWSIENRSHWVRDVTFGEDKSQVRRGNLPQMMAALRNCVINLVRLHNFRFIPDAFDYFAACPFEALDAIGR